MKNYYCVINKGGGMSGACFNRSVGWFYPVFKKEYMAKRFMEENPQKKGFMIIKKIKIDLRQSTP